MFSEEKSDGRKQETRGRRGDGRTHETEDLRATKINMGIFVLLMKS